MTPGAVARQAPLSIGFLRQEYWSGLPFLSPEHLPNPGIQPLLPTLAGGFFITEPQGKSNSALVPQFFHITILQVLGMACEVRDSTEVEGEVGHGQGVSLAREAGAGV